MKRLISLLAITTVCMTTGADPISREQAISIARQFLGSGAASTYTMQSPRKAQGRQQAPPAYYIVNRGKADGVVIVAGDDRLPAILGYSSTGEIDPARMPAGLRELLDLYSDEIGHFSTLGLNVTTGDAGWTRFSVPVSVPTGAHYAKFSFRGNVSNMAERLFLDNILVEDAIATGINTAAAAPGQAVQTYDLLGRGISCRALVISIEQRGDGRHQGKLSRKVMKVTRAVK